MDYQQAVDYIYSYMDFEVVPHALGGYDLRRVEELLAHIDNPQLRAKSVHIAGSKGKGSTAAMIASVLTTAGYTTGLYTSPHLHRINERVRVDGRLIADDEFAAIMTRLLPKIESVNQRATYGQLTTFELLTALAFTYFCDKAAAFQVLEVGLGGKYDASNVINAQVSVITSISYDHTEILGHTLTEIAGEKCGIIKPGNTVITAPQAAEAAAVIEAACLSNQARLLHAGQDITWQPEYHDLDRQQLKVNGRLGEYQLTIPLLGDHQLENAALAVAALEVLIEQGITIPRQSILQGLEQVNWPGRLQVLHRQPYLVVDGAHNPDSIRKLRQTLKQYFEFKRAVLIVGTSADKDIAGIVSGLLPITDRVIVTHSQHPRAAAAAPIVAEFTRQGVTAVVADDAAAALSLAREQAGPRDLICATGSLFIVAEVIAQANRVFPDQ